MLLRYVHGGLAMESTKGQDQNFKVNTQNREPVQTFQNGSNKSRPVSTSQKSRCWVLQVLPAGRLLFRHVKSLLL